MPRISEFYGIVIAMFYNDHEPPHVHAIYGEHRAIVGIDPVVTLRGRLPRRAESMVFEWLGVHRGELMDNWNHAREHRPLQPVAPLD